MRTSEEIAKEIVDNGMRVKQHIHSPVETMSDNLKLHITKAIAAERARAFDEWWEKNCAKGTGASHSYDYAEAAYLAGRESVLAQMPSEEEIRKEYQDDHERFLAREAIYWLKSRLESNGNLE